MLIHTGHDESRAQQVCEQIRALGRESIAYRADLTEENAADRLVTASWNWRAGVDIWINNAGADVLTTEAADWSFTDQLHLLWKVDVLGTMELSRQIGDRMRPRGGVILNIGWDQTETGMAGDSGQMFAATKGAVTAFTRSLAHSLAPAVRVNCLAPGWIRTAWGEQASDTWQRCAAAESLLGRWGTPEDVARVARFLASPSAAFITGQVVAVNGGRVGPCGIDRRGAARFRVVEEAMGEHYHFVTGRLAEHALRRVVEALAPQADFRYTIDVLPITVAALMTARWVARHLGDTSAATQIVLPGDCTGELDELQQQTGRPVRRGPRDLHALPEWFGQAPSLDDYGDYRIEILAEINHAPRLDPEELNRQARALLRRSRPDRSGLRTGTRLVRRRRCRSCAA